MLNGDLDLGNVLTTRSSMMMIIHYKLILIERSNAETPLEELRKNTYGGFNRWYWLKV